MDIYTIDKEYSCEIIIKKSRFIGYLFNVNNQSEAQEVLKEIRKKHYDATHNCYAYIIKDNDQTLIKSSDDGEPGGTAGVVIYEVLKKNNLTNIICIVTRYFGGIKLGAGGLVRAYSQSTAEAIKQISNLVKIEEKTKLCIEFNYDLINLIEKNMLDCTLLSKEFNAYVRYTYEIKEDLLHEVKQKLVNISLNQVRFINIE